MGLNVSVSDSLRVRVVKSAKNFKDVESDIKVSERLVKSAEIYVSRVHILHDEGGSFGHRVSDDIEQVDNVYSIFESLQNLDLSADLSLLNRLQDLYDDTFVVQGVDTLVNLRVLSSANLLDDFIVIL
jgi:hypothetical protein